MAWDYANPFGLNQVKLVKGATVVTLRATQVMSFSPRLMGGELKGSDKIVSVASMAEALEWSLEEGGIPLDALALMTGWTATLSGTTPNQVNTLKMNAGTALPFFKIYGKSLGDNGDDAHVKIWRAKVTGNIEGQFQYGEFQVTKLTGIAVQDAVNGLMDVVLNETAAALPTT